MAVKRRGVSVTGVRDIENVDLGRVLVTIDDLDALITALTETDTGKPPEIRFPDGVLEGPEDLRLLSDSELSDIQLHSNRVVVRLEHRSAKAGGEWQSVDTVTRWAEMRQTELRPRFPRARYVAESTWWAVWSLFFLTSVAGVAATWVLGESPLTRTIVVAGLVTVPAIAWVNRLFHRLPTSYAVVVPVSLAELRADLDLGRRHTHATTIAIGGLIVALIGLVVTIVLAR